ncbi:MAG TPA: peptidylprolyl isomerase [Bacteroidetes bacterium]|nr:peptidylprolyl isomerase [Bacteroidota bacterium]
MGMMVKIRQKVGSAMIFVLVLAFGGLWMLQDSGVFDSVGARTSRAIAVVDGTEISGELYDANVQQRMQLYQQQGVEITPAIQAQIENEVFDALVDNALRTNEMDRLGIEVSDAEVASLINGERPDPLILQLFPDGQGGVDRTRLREIVDQSGEDPELRAQLVALQEQIRTSRRQAKLDAMVSASVRVSRAEVEREFVRRNRRANARFVALRYADVPDGEVEVTEDDLRDYYRENAADFERKKTYNVEYVSFTKQPTAEDSTRAIAALRELRDEFASSDSPEAFARQNAFGAESAAEFVPAADLAPELASAIYSNPQAGRVVGPIVAGGEAVLARITDVRAADDPIVNARHILFPKDQRARAEQVKQEIQSGSITFADAARQYSTDESNASRGGELGWFGRGRMVRPFEEAAFSAPAGRVTGPVETQFGWHLIRVEGRSTQEAEIVRIARAVEGNYGRVREAAEDFQIFTEEEDRDFVQAAQEENLEVTSVLVAEDQTFVPGLQVGRPFFRFLRSAAEGSLSEPIDAGDRFVVARLTEVLPEGTRPFEEVRTQIEAEVLTQKKRAIQAERLRAALEGGAASLDALAQSIGGDVQTADGLSLASPTVAGFGREPSLVGAAFGLKPGQRSGVVEGENAVFVVQTTALRGGLPDEMTEVDRDQIAAQLLQRKRQQVQTAWLQELREEADIEDFRADLLG